MYLVIEIQKNGNAISQIVTTHTELKEAEQTYHTILAAAAVSEVDVHSAVLMLYDGKVLKKESYYHNGEA